MASSSIPAALKQLNLDWFTHIRPRWVDILGSYAGKELFLVDGDALVQYVLDDRLVGIGRNDSCDWQILHAIYAVESFLEDLKKRGAVFEIVFFTGKSAFRYPRPIFATISNQRLLANRPLAIGTSSNSWISSSRALGHKVLKAYIENLEFDVHEFEDVDDQEWKDYLFFNKPLFVLGSDHTHVEEHTDEDETATAAANLLHRIFIKEVHDAGLLFASIQEVDFRDSQALTFLYDGRHRNSLGKSIRQAVQEARSLLSSLNPAHSAEDSESEESDSESTSSKTLAAWSLEAARDYISSNPSPAPAQQALLFTFLVHSQLLQTIDLSLRSQPAPSLPSNVLDILTREFLPALFTSLQKTMPEEIEAPPSVDGRIYAILLDALLQSEQDIPAVVGDEVYKAVLEQWTSELELPPVDFGALRQLSSSGSSPAKSTTAAEFHEFALYPFTAPILTDLLSPSHVQVPTKALDDFGGTPAQLEHFGAQSESVFAPSKRHIPAAGTTRGPPLPKHLGGDPPRPKDKKGLLKVLKKNQRDMVHIDRQASSLTGVKGAKLEAEVVPPTNVYIGAAAAGGITSQEVSRAATPLSDASPARHAHAPKGKKGSLLKENSTQSSPVKGGKGGGGKKGGAKEPPMKSADKLRAQIEAQKKVKSSSDGETWWRNRLDELKNISDLGERIEMLDLQLKNNKRLDDTAGGAGASLAANVWLYRISCECWHWVENPRRADKHVKDGYTVKILKMVMGMKQFSAAGQNLLTPTMVKSLWSVLEVLGFDDYLQIIPKPTKDVVDKKLEWDFIKFYKKSKSGPNAGTLINSYPWMAIGEDPVDWQLRVFGEHMDRSFDSQKDDRVRFEPDKWQREVLDRLDAKESVLVVAPTSAGKTFISYYAMKQVLTESDDGILVYVAPTKALVTQIAAEVYARYRKDLKGRSCWAFHTPDIRMNNPQTCQILITVPETLAFMLLSPNMAKLWTPRIRRIILDEIHTLGTQPGGVWEQILLLARCPIIGLSATVGDAEEFNEWLKSVQETHGHKHSLVQHHHRYSHLRKFTYNIDPDPEPLDGLPSHKAGPQMRFLHPISFIRPGITELPSDLALEARDCATLYKAMSMHSKDPDVGKLKPTRFFKKLAEKGVFLQQKDVIRYEEELKAVLTNWLEEEDAHEETSTIQKVVKQLSDKEVGQPESEEALENREHFFGNLVNLLADLHANGDLPALLFHFDRYHVEEVAKAILERLKKDEAEWRKHSPEWAKKVKGWEDWEAGAKEREKAAQRAALKKEKAEGDKMDRLQAAAAVDSSPLAIYANFDPDAPSEEFTFINWGTRYSASELEEDIKSLAWSDTPKFLLEALRRGVAVHHSGLPKVYRVLVETLFRIGFCRVVVSTEDLALGVNMPAKASVFCGDSPALNALMYRQCAGRAGRRGFDLLGKVIFYGIPHERVKQVVLSRLPALRGNYPLTPTLSLRLITLLTNSGYAPSATHAVSDLLKLDSLTIGSNISREQTLFNMRFAVEYLIRARLIDSNGSPLYPWCNLATFLYTAEPANLAFLSLFRSGYIHKICNNSDIIEAKQKLMHVLAFLFCRQYVSKTNFDKAIFAANNRTPSKVLLPALDQEAYDILREHNQEVLNVFTECAVMYSVQQADTLQADKALPLSKRSVDHQPAPSSTLFTQRLNQSRISSRSRSAFVATSGHGDVYTDVDELTRTVREGVHLTKHILPTLETFESGDQSGRYINAYLWDFYNHGQESPMSQANGIPRGHVWYLLMEFSNVLDAIITGVKEVMVKDVRGVDDEFGSVVGESVVDRERGVQDDWAADLEKDETVVVVTTSAKAQNAGLEKEKGDEAEATALMTSSDPELVKPDHVPVRDWKVYDVFYQLQKDFNEKFKAMWA